MDFKVLLENKKVFIGIIAVILALVIGTVVAYSSFFSPEAKYEKYLELGQKYLLEENYEEAVVAFARAIEIDPKRVEAYEKIADAYIGLGDEEKALEYLNKGYEMTKAVSLKAYAEKISTAMSEKENAELFEKYGLDKETAKGFSEILEEKIKEMGIGSTDPNYLKYLSSNGVLQAELLDFNNDGSKELFIAYTNGKTTESSGDMDGGAIFEVWQKVGEETRCVYKKENLFYEIGRGNRGFSLVRSNDRVYLVEDYMGAMQFDMTYELSVIDVLAGGKEIAHYTHDVDYQAPTEYGGYRVDSEDELVKYKSMYKELYIDSFGDELISVSYYILNENGNERYVTELDDVQKFLDKYLNGYVVAPKNEESFELNGFTGKVDEIPLFVRGNYEECSLYFDSDSVEKTRKELAEILER